MTILFICETCSGPLRVSMAYELMETHGAEIMELEVKGRYERLFSFSFLVFCCFLFDLLLVVPFFSDPALFLQFGAVQGERGSCAGRRRHESGGADARCTNTRLKYSVLAQRTPTAQWKTSLRTTFPLRMPSSWRWK